MSHTYSSAFFHAVWSTKNRTPMIEASFCNRLYTYIGGIIKNENGNLLAIGGMPDHVHLLMQIAPKNPISNLVCRIKANSSKFTKQKFSQHNFAWQEGYGLFSVSVSMLPKVKNYIFNQEKHHKECSFENELIQLLKKHKVDFDNNFLFNLN